MNSFESIIMQILLDFRIKVNSFESIIMQILLDFRIKVNEFVSEIVEILPYFRTKVNDFESEIVEILASKRMFLSLKMIIFLSGKEYNRYKILQKLSINSPKIVPFLKEILRRFLPDRVSLCIFVYFSFKK